MQSLLDFAYGQIEYIAQSGQSAHFVLHLSAIGAGDVEHQVFPYRLRNIATSQTQLIDNAVAVGL